ncbi:MAG: ABC transporter ATP-binding protein [Pseudomonadota bacterium]
MSLLSVRNLTVGFGDQDVVRRVSFDLAEGQVLGLVGESGSGKSITALSVMQLLPPEARMEGAVELERRDLNHLSERTMCDVRGRDIGMIFQEPMTALNPLKTIGDQVAETLVIHGVARGARALARARFALDRVGLPEERFPLSRYPHELSGGQRQRVAIAMAVALKPKLLIADEPTTALDVTTQAQILSLLQDLVRKEGLALMLITHDLAVVSQVADQVAVMKDGQIVEAGRTESLFRRRHHPYTRRLFDAASYVPPRTPLRLGPPLLEVRGVVREYRLPRKGLIGAGGSLRAVDQVNLTVGQGESVGLVGESGCGKSTLSRAILGLEPLQGGQINLAGRKLPEPRKVPGSLRRKMQVVFQDPFGSFNPRHKVRRLVSEPFYLLRGAHGDTGTLVAEALRAVGLKPAVMDRYIHEFSGGQRQRIAIARALITRPELIVLDEAVSALDVSIRAQILDLLTELRQEFGLAYLFISHDLGVVRAITDRVYVMKAGCIVEDGPTHRVLSAPRDAYTKELIGATPRIPDAWAEEAAG